MQGFLRLSTGVAALLALTGCIETLEGGQPYAGAGSVIATGEDQGYQKGVLKNGEAAIAYDPDGCQNWVIDDGLEGYSSPRFDPVSGLPICNDLYPPGTVLRPYETEAAGVKDQISGPGRKTVVVKR
ncbi:hypothetical protein LHP98_09145 [Rhodobacter sp. Har01]|uniref:hypothetical protein n=1 Tax=Rhodobacter sp. Har01 TaxID=2883999 RepID=UPI001D061C57|nr:hypothetical protein [Rhodobacter sp. Har01]MCB6178295.1 hypothetical protein [Rhodobacter sp. Har01]